MFANLLREPEHLFIQLLHTEFLFPESGKIQIGFSPEEQLEGTDFRDLYEMEDAQFI